MGETKSSVASHHGRATKLTPAVQARICQAVAAGNYLEAAAQFGGVDYATVRRWLVRGEREPGPYRVFCEAILKAQADAEVTVVAQWRSQIPENWAAARDFLARRFPERWGPKARLEHTGEGGKEIRFQVVYGETGSAPAETARLSGEESSTGALLVDEGGEGDDSGESGSV